MLVQPLHDLSAAAEGEPALGANPRGRESVRRRGAEYDGGVRLHLYLVHHGDAVGPEVDPQRPLSASGLAHVTALAADAARRGAKPAVVWHSGKLRAKQTAEAFWRACNALAELAATRDLQPTDPPFVMRDRMRGETRDVMLVGHFPHLPALLALLVGHTDTSFPSHGIVALASEDEGESWTELWKLEVRG